MLTRWCSPGCASTAHSVGHVHRCPGAHATEVVAREVDDHHVLGVVLARCARSAPRVGGGALDRAGLDVAVGARRRKRSGDAETTAMPAAELAGVQQREVRRRVRARERVVQRDRVERVVAREPAGEVHLVALAGAEQLEHRRRRGRRTSSRSRPLCQRVAGIGGELRAARRSAATASLEQRAARAVAAHGDAASRVDHREGVEPGEHHVGHRSRARSTRRGRRPVRRRDRARTRTNPPRTRGVSSSSAAKPAAPDAVTISAGADPHHGGAPAPHRRHRGTGGQAADQPGRDEIGVSHRATLQAGSRPFPARSGATATPSSRDPLGTMTGP